VVELRPLRGLRYDLRRVGDAGAVLAPPFDTISPKEREALEARSPWNVVRLEKPRAEPGDDGARNAYTRAAETLRAWLRDGILVRDASERLFLHEQEFEHGGARHLRRSLVSRIRLSPAEKGGVRPHEGTLAAPKEDRLRLLRALEVQASPIFGLYADEDGAVSCLLDAFAGPPLVAADDAAGQRHRLRPIDGAEAHASLAEHFRPKTLTIADGHHRYETALAFCAERKAAASGWSGEEPGNFVMMGLTATEDPGLLVLPFHRIVKRPPPPDFLARLAPRWHVAGERPRAPAAELLRWLAEEGRGRTAIGFHDGRVFRALVSTDPAPRLDVDRLHEDLLAPFFGITAEEVARREAIDFTMDAEEALRAPLSFLLHPTPARAVIDAAEAGRKMPPKSTAFFPKLPTGLVLHPLAS
jgi:uncharacterized protein (DUF1015 family)